MNLSTLVSALFSGSSASGSDAQSAAPADRGTLAESATIIHECRICGTTVSAEKSHCPACDSDDIATYSID